MKMRGLYNCYWYTHTLLSWHAVFDTRHSHAYHRLFIHTMPKENERDKYGCIKYFVDWRNNAKKCFPFHASPEQYKAKMYYHAWRRGQSPWKDQRGGGGGMIMTIFSTARQILTHTTKNSVHSNQKSLFVWQNIGLATKV